MMMNAPVIVPRMELTVLINRLEAATSRLEDIASAAIEAPKTNGSLPAAASIVAGGIAIPPTPQMPKTVAEPLPALVEDFDTFITNSVKNYVNLSDAIGGSISEQVRIILPGRISKTDTFNRLLNSIMPLLDSENSSTLLLRRRSQI
jgi:Adenylate cyclase associated (CAP) N terminal